MKILLVTGKDGERKLVGTRVFNRYYKQNIRPEDTRDSVQALRKEKLFYFLHQRGVLNYLINQVFSQFK